MDPQRNMLLWPLIAAFVVLAVVTYMDRRPMDSVRAKGHQACLVEGHAEADCIAWADMRFEDCYRLNYLHETRGSPAKFDKAGYVRCVQGSD